MWKFSDSKTKFQKKSRAVMSEFLILKSVNHRNQNNILKFSPYSSFFKLQGYLKMKNNYLDFLAVESFI